MKVKDIPWEDWKASEDDTLLGYRMEDGGKITVLDRMTGYGYGVRDVETGYRDPVGNFWLASGRFDIREWPEKTLKEAVSWIKRGSNTCQGDNAREK